jgi:hypothetical protein
MPDYAALLARLGIAPNEHRLAPVDPTLHVIRNAMMQATSDAQRAAVRAARALSAP